MSYRAKTAWLLAVAGYVTACGGGSTEPVTVDALSASFDPLAAARAAYGVTATRPADFFDDTDPYPDRLTLTAHVRLAVIDPASTRDIDLCSDDGAEAQTLAERHAATFAASPTLVSTDTTPWYYEASFDLKSVDPTMLRSRVYRCAALDRDAPIETALARLNRTPLDRSDVKFAVEYLWTFSADNTALQAVLSSDTTQFSDGFEHEIVRVTVQKFVGADRCDRLTIWRDSYRVDLADRLLTRRQTPLESFEARYRSGDAELCGD
ncbi:MAG: hypothetical protein AAGH76_01665 [Pseudomonadota bacterium]